MDKTSLICIQLKPENKGCRSLLGREQVWQFIVNSNSQIQDGCQYSSFNSDINLTIKLKHGLPLHKVLKHWFQTQIRHAFVSCYVIQKQKFYSRSFKLSFCQKVYSSLALKQAGSKKIELGKNAFNLVGRLTRQAPTSFF